MDTTDILSLLSMKMGVFMDAKGEMATLSIKQGLFLDAKGKLTALARKRGVFLAAKTGDKKRDTLDRMSLYRLNHSRVLQRRVIRVSETFGES